MLFKDFQVLVEIATKCSLMPLLATSAIALSQGTVVGSGGDPIRVILEQSRDYAATILPRVKSQNLMEAGVSEDIRLWLADKQTAIARDIALSPHVIVDELPGFCPAVNTCACTTRDAAAPIYFSLKNCAALDSDFATELLIHESSHHFGVENEDFADGLARALFKAYDRIDIPHWRATSRQDALSPRWSHTAVWDGQQMIVFGGCSQESQQKTRLGDGAHFNPTDQTWTVLSSIGSPTPRCGHAAVFTGTDMLIWGGDEVVTPHQTHGTGAAYNAASDSWRPLPTANAPSPRVDFAQGWNGDTWFICGGSKVPSPSDPDDPGIASDAAIFRTGQGSWWRSSTVDLCKRRNHSAVWVGQGANGRFVVWGGRDESGESLASGGLYDPRRNVIEPLPTEGAPSPRFDHTVAVIDDKMIVYGGRRDCCQVLSDGAIFDLTLKTWRPLPTDSAPDRRYGAIAVVSGTEMFMFGGADQNGGQVIHDRMISIFNTNFEEWLGMRVANAPTGRINHSVVWTGESVLIWGGRTLGGNTPHDGENALDNDAADIGRNDGGIFMP